MKAKDTVMNADELLGNYYDVASPLDRETVVGGLREIAKAQAEITAPIFLKEGIREVIRYLVSDDNGLRIEIRGPKWGEQLKKWEIA